MAVPQTTFSINTFTSSKGLKAGGALSSLFQVTVSSLPAGVANLDQMLYLTKGANLPTSAIDTTEVSFMGRPLKIPMNRASQDWTTSVYNDEGMEIRGILEEWMRLISSHQTNVRSENHIAINTYTGTLNVEQFGKDGSATGNKYTFHKAWPSTLTEIALSWDTNEIETYDVTWAYSYWFSDKIKS